MKIAIGCDEAAYDMKGAIEAELEKQATTWSISARTTPSPCSTRTSAWRSRNGTARGGAEHGLLFCGTGMGTAISANKLPGIRADADLSVCPSTG